MAKLATNTNMNASKLRREMQRVLRGRHWVQQLRYQIQRTHSAILGAPDFVDYSDFMPDVSAGDHLIGFVIYAPDGIRADTLYVLKAMTTMSRVKPMALCNHALSIDDRSQLHALGVPFVQANNKGRDFATYRNFCLSLAKRFEGKAPDLRLTLMNDSFVFPLFGTVQDLLSQLDGPGVCGLLEQRSSRVNGDYLCSFCLSLQGQILLDPVFLSFWRGFRPLADRAYTIRSGEVALSRVLQGAGHKLRVLYQKDQLTQALAQATLAKLKSALEPLRFNDLIQTREVEQWAGLDAQTLAAKLMDLVDRTQSLRLLPLFTLFCGLPIAKKRDFCDYPALNHWYSETYDLGIQEILP